MVGSRGIGMIINGQPQGGLCDTEKLLCLDCGYQSHKSTRDKRQYTQVVPMSSAYFGFVT